MRPAAVALLALVLPLSAVAQFMNAGTSLNPVGSGARAMGQGNAFIAVADDATAASWNPAGLTQLEKPELSLALEGIDSHAELDSETHPESERARIRGDTADLNYLSGVVPLRFAKHAVFSLNYLRMYRFDRSFEGPYSLRAGTWGQNSDYTIEQEGALTVLAPALAVDVTPKLALGVALNAWADDLTGNSEFRSLTTEYAHFFDRASGKTGDQWRSWEDRFTVDDGFSWNLGAMYRPTRAWTLAAVVKPPFTLEMNHTTTMTDYQTGDFGWTPDTYQETTNEAELTMPLIVGAGVAWRPSDPWTMSADVTWTQWSRYKLREFGEDRNPITSRPWAREACKDTTTVRVGLEYLVIRDAYLVPLRCGFGYDPGPAPEEVDEFWTASVGTGLQWSRYALDVAYEARYGDGVNRGLHPGLGQQDFLQHRVLLSMIVYWGAKAGTVE